MVRAQTPAATMVVRIFAQEEISLSFQQQLESSTESMPGDRVAMKLL